MTTMLGFCGWRLRRGDASDPERECGYRNREITTFDHYSTSLCQVAPGPLTEKFRDAEGFNSTNEAAAGPRSGSNYGTSSCPTLAKIAHLRESWWAYLIELISSSFDDDYHVTLPHIEDKSDTIPGILNTHADRLGVA